MSSPVLTTTVTSASCRRRRRDAPRAGLQQAARKRAPPMPPASTVIRIRRPVSRAVSRYGRTACCGTAARTRRSSLSRPRPVRVGQVDHRGCDPGPPPAGAPRVPGPGGRVAGLVLSDATDPLPRGGARAGPRGAGRHARRRPRRRRCCTPAARTWTDLLVAAARVRDAGARPAGRPGRRHLLAQGVHPADPAVPRPLPLLHVRHRARQAARAGHGCTCRPTRSSTIARQGARAGLQGGAVHPRRPARGPLAGGAASGWTSAATTRTLDYVRAMAIRVLEETGLLPHLNPGRDALGGAAAAQAGRAVDGDDAGDDVDAAVRPSRAARTTAARTRTRRSGCGCSRTPAGCRSRSPPACWSASARRWPSGPSRSSRSARRTRSTGTSRK